MHANAYQWIVGQILTLPDWRDLTVLDLGGRDVNGVSHHRLFDHPPVVVDIEPGPNVTHVADAATWTPDQTYDLVLCTEVLEHTPDWAQILNTAQHALHPGGILLMTCAGPTRPAHNPDGSEWDGHTHYQPLHPYDIPVEGWAELRCELHRGAYQLPDEDFYMRALR